MSGSGALPHSLCRASALSVSRPATLSLSASYLGGLRVGPGRSPALPVSAPSALCAAAALSATSSDPRATQRHLWFCGPPAPTPGPRAPSSNPRTTHPAQRVPFFQERTPNLTVSGNIYYSMISHCTIFYRTIPYHILLSHYILHVFRLCLIRLYVLKICFTLSYNILHHTILRYIGL